MRPTDHLDIVGLVKLRDDVGAEEVTCASRRHAPPLSVLWIGPQEVTHGSVVRNLLLPIDRANLVERLNGRAESAVYAKDLAVDDGAQAQVVEDLGAVTPHGDRAVFAQTLVVKAVDLRDLPRLVIAPDERDAIRITNFQGQQEQKGLYGVEAAIDKVAHEEVICIGDVAADFEELFEVVELSVDVAADGDGRVDALDVGLFNEDFPGFGAERLHLGLFDDFTSSQLFDLSVEVALIPARGC